MKIGFAQINPTVGDLKGNCELILGAYERLAAAGAELVLTPELAITGYPPQDLVFKSRFVPENLAVLEKLHARVESAALLVGFVDRNEGRGKPFHNAAALLERGKPIRKAYKCLLPTYDVFDEDRYFEPAHAIVPLNFRGRKIGLTICEDIWTERYLSRPFYDVDPVRTLVADGAEIIVNVSASPFSLGKPIMRREMISGLAAKYHRPIFYCNAIGGNDELVFDGNSIDRFSALDFAGLVIRLLILLERLAFFVRRRTISLLRLHEIVEIADGIADKRIEPRMGLRRNAGCVASQIRPQHVLGLGIGDRGKVEQESE